MDLRQAMKHQLDATEHQVDSALRGLDGDQWDARIRSDLMSPKEIVVHLTECYIAAQEHAAGKEHAWGTYNAIDDDPKMLVEEMKKRRALACEALLSKADEDSFKAASDYIVLHDAYHVGQLAAVRLGVTPDWDPYSIYT